MPVIGSVRAIKPAKSPPFLGVMTVLAAPSWRPWHVGVFPSCISLPCCSISAPGHLDLADRDNDAVQVLLVPK